MITEANRREFEQRGPDGVHKQIELLSTTRKNRNRHMSGWTRRRAGLTAR
jgi:hypothetical protein